LYNVRERRLNQGLAKHEGMGSVLSTVKPTRYTNLSNLFYFGMTFYMFRTVFPSIIRSSRLDIQQYLFDKCLLLYVQS